MADYEGIKIPKKIGIVEKHNGQGYVVYPDDKKMIESARNWAGTSYLLDTYKINEKGWREYDRVEYDPKLYVYDNGQFELTVTYGAKSSCSWSQGGKLSFWDCTIKAPDGKEFLIGINSDALASLIKNSDMHQGKVEQRVWLGRKKTNVVAYTELMEEFKQAQSDEALRTAKKTNKYNVGDIVKTLTTEDLYCGEFCKYLDEAVEWDPDNRWNKQLIITVHSTPKTVHVFKSTYWMDSRAKTFAAAFKVSEDDEGDSSIGYIDLLNTKPARLPTGRVISGVTAERVYNGWIKDPPEPAPNDAYRHNYKHDLEERKYRRLVYGIDPTKLPTEVDIMAVFAARAKAATSSYDSYYGVNKIIIKYD